MNLLQRRPLAASAPSQTPRRVLLGGLGLLLFAYGQFEQAVFAALGQLWQGVGPLAGPGAGATGELNGLSTHGLPVGITYRLLYCGLSGLMLHVLLRGRRTWWVVGGYAVALSGSMVLLVLGQQAGWPVARAQGHQVLDLVCSPLPLVAGYVLRTLPGGIRS